ncbi:MAG: DUF5123 domain-containing protein, partial [Fuerstiella sp.]|nr:DUF5123 domain-containing protein [Fuerstiella sp.]
AVDVPLAKAGDNTFIYRFHAVGGGDTVELPSGSDLTVTVSNNRPVLSWTDEAYFASGGVYPNTGGLGSNYEFRISYTDADGECPTSNSSDIQVWIDENDNGYEAGEQHNLLESDAGDTDCTDGKIYRLTRALSTAGPHNYRFYTTDGEQTATADPEPVSDNTLTVNATANTPPLLEWQAGVCVTSGVKPALGAAAEDFTFTVNYTDQDGCPSGGAIQTWIDLDGGGYSAIEQHDMSEVDPADTDCTDGKLYQYVTPIASVGSYNYRFHANDGTNDGVGEATASSTVETIDAVAVHAGESIQEAIDPSANTTILVYEGTYNENILLDRALTGPLGNPVARDNNITLQSVCGPEVTTIRASDDTAPTVHFYQITNPVIDGFTLSNGSDGVKKFQTSIIVKNCIIEDNERGINSWHQSGSITVEDTIIRNNITAGNGAGIYIYGGGPHSISGSTITNNESTGGTGGGIWVRLPILTIENTTISNNKTPGGAFMGGGGIWSRQSTLNLDKVTIKSNTTEGAGGGLYLTDWSVVTMTNSNVVDNTASGTGGGLYLGNYNDSPINLTMNNCTVSNNNLTDTTDGEGGGIYTFRLSNVTINNSIFWGNKAAGLVSAHEAYASLGATNTFSFTSSVVMNIRNNFTASGGNIDFDANCINADPMFVDSANGDYHLKSISPAIDQGTATDAPADDIDGDDRPDGTGYDMGADEFAP